MRWDRVVMGATLIAIGVLFLLDRADVLDAGQVIGDWWPAVIVGFGLVTLAERPVSLLGPVLLVAVGVLLLLVTNDVLETSAWNVIWPAALIAFGLTSWSATADVGITSSWVRDTIRTWSARPRS